jgi:sialidase-1
MRLKHLLFLLTIVSIGGFNPCPAAEPGIKKLQDAVIYKDDRFYCSFPSVVRRPDGELMVAFRRAPNRRAWGEQKFTHTDPNSYLVLVRSRDDGKTWSTEPELMFAHPFGGSQDPCMVQLDDTSILCSSYGWALLNTEAKDVYKIGKFGFLGGFLLRSRDSGHSWQGPMLPPATPDQRVMDPFGKPVPAFNRGAMCQGKDGKVYWAVAASSATNRERTETHLMVSPDRGQTWSYSCPIASDSKVTFNETSLYETSKGDLVAFLRTEGFDDHTALGRSTNHGKSFDHWSDAGFQGHPHYALRLPDQRVLLVYGYRHSPFGVRARVLDAECTQLVAATEIVLRDDGGNGDLGYPWATLISDRLVLVVYYFNQGDGTRHIAATFLSIEAKK